MAEGTPSGDAFGFLTAPDQGTPNDPLEDNFGEEAPQAPEQGTEETQQAPVQEPQATETQTEPSTEEAEAQRKLYADRYQSIEDLEAGYKNIQRLQTRTAEQLRAAELQRQQMEAALQQALPYIQAQSRQEQQPEFDDSDPQQLQAFINQRVQEESQRQVAQLQQQQVVQQTETAIDSFRQRHPDAAPGTPIDVRMAQVIVEQQTDADGRHDPSSFPVTEQNLELTYQLAADERLLNMITELDLIVDEETIQIAREAIEHPALAEVLMANPQYAEAGQAGFDYARKQANLPQVLTNAAASAAPANPEEMRKRAFVETGPGAPGEGAPGKRPKDEFDEALSVFNEGKQNSIFG